MILFKTNVRLKKYSRALRHILEVLDNLNMEQIPDYPINWTITSINDSTHMKNSRHYTDEALDLRSKNFNNALIKKEFVQRLMFVLGKKFIVLLENTGTPNEHFHIQVMKGQVYP